MIFPDFAQFSRLAQQGNFIPVYYEWIADLETPVSAWYKVCAGRPYSFLLESVEGGENIGRYSFLGCDPVWVLESRGDITRQFYRDGRVVEHHGNPFTIIKNSIESIKPVTLEELPSGIGGLFGFWGYELIRWIEPTVPVHQANSGELPDGIWMQIDTILIFDQVKRKIWAVAYADLSEPLVDLRQAYDYACAKVNRMVLRLKIPLDVENKSLELIPASNHNTLDFQSNTSVEQYCQNVEKAKKYIKSGDIFQVVLSQRISAPYSDDPFNLYRSLRVINPSPYMAYFNFNKWQLIGSSPEIMVKVDRMADAGFKATVRPIAGTRHRGKTPDQDNILAKELLEDPKEIAEHVMLVDLGRNDLGRVCKQGSVCVNELMIIERYSHVMHIVSNVIGEVSDDKDAWDVLQACFPAGTVSGAPKIRAMEIIHEIEGEHRGPYSGVYGYYDFEGQLNSAITIRTMIVQPDSNGSHLVTVQAGAGIVADSQPAKEYEETINKARGVLESIRRLG